MRTRLNDGQVSVNQIYAMKIKMRFFYLLLSRGAKAVLGQCHSGSVATVTACKCPDSAHNAVHNQCRFAEENTLRHKKTLLVAVKLDLKKELLCGSPYWLKLKCVCSIRHQTKASGVEKVLVLIYMLILHGSRALFCSVLVLIHCSADWHCHNTEYSPTCVIQHY